MSALAEITEPLPTPPVGADALEKASTIAAGSLMPMAMEIDREGIYPETVMRELGAAGAFSQHTAAFGPNGKPDLMGAIDSMAAAGEACMSTAFCMWCQDASVWYLEATENTALRESLQSDLALGRELGGTGLSNPMKHFSGIETLKLRGQRVDGGYVVTGALPWVSNLGEDHYFGAIFELADKPEHKVMGMFRCNMEGVSIAQNAHFIALEGTRTVSVKFKKAFIPDEMILSDPAEKMVKKIKPGFILLQAGMALGVIQGCINDMLEADKSVGHVNAFLDDRPEIFQEALPGLRASVAELAATPFDESVDFFKQVLDVRLAASEWSLRAAQAAMMHMGARGYLEGASANRRMREAYFVAIVTPAIKHLKKEIAALAS